MGCNSIPITVQDYIVIAPKGAVLLFIIPVFTSLDRFPFHKVQSWDLLSWFPPLGSSFFLSSFLIIRVPIRVHFSFLGTFYFYLLQTREELGSWKLASPSSVRLCSKTDYILCLPASQKTLLSIRCSSRLTSSRFCSSDSKVNHWNLQLLPSCKF